jgi:hypothetical protein
MSDFVIKTDFNDVLDDGRITALPKNVRGRGPGLPAVGAPVEVVDWDGNTCAAVVDEVRDDLVYLNVDWDTWTDGQVTEVGFSIPTPTRGRFMENLRKVAKADRPTSILWKPDRAHTISAIELHAEPNVGGTATPGRADSTEFAQ